MPLVRKPGSGKRRSAAKKHPLDEASLRLAAIIDSSDDAIISKDLNGAITSWNAAATRLFGYTPEEIIGQSILTLIPPGLQQQESEVLQKLAAGQRIEHYETIRVCKDGSYRDISLTISPIRDASGKLVGASKIARDISGRKRLDETRFRLAAIVDSSDDAIISKDLNGTISSWNAAATRLFGWPEHEIVGRPVLTLIPPELHHEEPEILRKLRAGERIEHYETQRLHKNGAILDVSITVSPVRGPNGQVIGASKIVRDISERRRIHQVLMESEKLAVAGRMAATIAHEINNPLEAATNLAYLLSTDRTLNPMAQKYAELLLECISRASLISKQTLAFYRETGKPAQINLGAMLDSVIELNRGRLLNKNINVQRDYEAVEPVFGYAGEIRQVLANLLLNAIDAVPVRGTIYARISKDPSHEGRVRFSLADNGAGIAPAIRTRLFNPFFTTKGTLGNGLGLWVSRGIVEKHGGKIALRSCTRPGRSGTVFSILLPRHKVENPLQKVA